MKVKFLMFCFAAFLTLGLAACDKGGSEGESTEQSSGTNQ
jgi:hypothetical protein